MSSTEKVSQNWRQIAATGETEPDGTHHLSLHMMDTVSGHDFVITLSGIGTISSAYWAGAIAAAATVYARAAGIVPGSTSVQVTPQPTNH